MTLQAIVDDLEALPEEVRGFYKQDGSSYKLDVEGVEFPDDVKGVKNALNSERRMRQNLEKQIAKFPQDFDADRWEELKDLADKGGKKVEPDPADIAKRWEKKLSEKEEEIARRDAQIKNLTVDLELDRAIADSGFIDDARVRNAVKALMEKRGPAVVEGENGYMGVFKDDVGREVPIVEYVKGWARTEEAEPFLPSSGAKGGGSKGSSAGGVGSKKPYSQMSEQDKVAYVREHGQAAFLEMVSANRKTA